MKSTCIHLSSSLPADEVVFFSKVILLGSVGFLARVLVSGSSRSPVLRAVYILNTQWERRPIERVGQGYTSFNMEVTLLLTFIFPTENRENFFVMIFRYI